MNIIVCLKQILDPEMAPKDFKIDAASRRPIQGNTNMVMDSFSENALEAALQFRTQFGGKITVLCVGDNSTDHVLRRAYSLTVDAAVRVWDPAWSELDANNLAYVLSQAIGKLEGADLILCGRQSGDLERGLVGAMLAEELGAACVGMVYQIEKADELIRFKCETDDGSQTVESHLPAVATVTSNEINVPRLPKVKDVMMATRKPITVFGRADLNLEDARMSPFTSLQDIFIPVQTSTCELIEGDDGPAKAVNLAGRIKELKVL